MPIPQADLNTTTSTTMSAEHNADEGIFDYYSLSLWIIQSIILIDFFNMMIETRYFLVVNLSNFDAVIFSVNQCSHTKYKLYIGNRYAQGPRNRGVREAYEFSQIL